MHAAMVIAVGFALIILAGTLLLMLPCAAKSGRATPFIDALFTATSATCVTGLVTVGTAVHWSLFGKCVILLLIQIGGLGFMSVMTATSLLLRRTITLRERMVIGAGFGLDSSGGIVRLMRRVLVGTFLFEGVGAALLSIRFVQQFGPLRGVGMGVFHAVSAFCNGGFDLMGTPDDPFCSLVHYAEEASIYVRQQKYEDALKSIERAIAIAPDFGACYRLRGVCCVRLKKKTEACEAFNKAKELGDPLAGKLIKEHCK